MAAQDNRRGLMFALLAMIIFASQDGISKHLAANYPPVFVVMIRYWAFALFVLLWAAGRPGGIVAVARTRRPWLQAFRGAFLGLQVVVAITAFARVGLADTMAIFSASPLLVAALSMPVLGERVGWRRWTAICVGFAGVLVILQPGSQGLHPEAWLAVLAAAGIAIYGVLTRLASRTDSADTSFFWTAMGGVVVLSLIGPAWWTPMTAVDWGWMALASVSATAGHYCLIRAFAVADAVVVQPVTYLQLVLSSLIGIAVFGEVLKLSTVAGAAIVIAAGGFTFWREAMLARRGRAAAAAARRKGAAGAAA